MTDQRRELDVRIQKEKDVLEKVITDLGLDGNGKHFFCPGCQSESEETPELSIQKGEFYCFKCGTRGDLVGLVKLARGCDLEDAIAWLAAEHRKKTERHTGH